jgi:hypothetical protein
MTKAPALDGKVDPGEWDRAVAFDGLSFQGQLEERRCRAYVGATETDLYVAFVSEMPKKGHLVANVNTDTPKLVFDDSVEVWIDLSPGKPDARIYQALVNSKGRIAYIAQKRGNVPEMPNWQGHYKIANGFHDGFWHCEMQIPISDLAPDRKATDGSFGINVCRNWKQPWQFSSLGAGSYSPEAITFTFGQSPVSVAFEHRTDPTTRDIKSLLRVRNWGAQGLTVKADMLLTRDAMPDIHNADTLTVPAGGMKEFELAAKDETTRKFTLAANVTSADGATTYYSRSYAWGPPRAQRWTAVQPVVLPIDFKFAYYPYLNRMRILCDWSGLRKSAKLQAVNFDIRQRNSRGAVVSPASGSAGGTPAPRVVASAHIPKPEGTRKEIAFDLPPLNGQYEIVMTATGTGVPNSAVIKPFERTVYEWEHNNLGKSTKVYPPFTPIRVQGKTLSTVLRDHSLTDIGLWSQVNSTGKDLLAAPMAFEATVSGAPAKLTASPLAFTQQAGNQVVARSAFSLGTVKAAAQQTWDYDGTMRYDLTLQPSLQQIDSLDLVIPIRNDQASHYHAMGDGIRNTLYERVPAGEGTVWTSAKVNASDFPRNFCTYIYVGTPKRGLCWFAENDRGWSWDQSKPNVELVRTGDRLEMRVHLINKPITITQPRRMTFGLLAAPVKPRLPGWRTKWVDDRYSILGTDINWFALGDCGSVYPAEKDMYLWKMLAEGNKRKLSDEEVESVVKYGRKYFEPYGEDKVKMYEAHVRYNLRSRYNTTMVFYYNRSSFQKADEFQTFGDEWCRDDYRAFDKGIGIGEIPIVPSESYIDHALYWYGKSFDIANNRGVYWDNWFFNSSFNRQMTAAYEREDGSVMPSTGIWGLRELSKRTFQYMNERGMTPITMPHMTSTNILPMHSFATVQYDWEWHYSEGDFQDRFTRDYILLVTNGELAGAWPVLLGDHGKLENDPWTQRTFAGVSLVHEIIGSGWDPVWNKLREPIMKLTRRSDVKVYRYWDEESQPVTAGNPDLPGIVFSIKGQEAIYLVCSYSAKDEDARVTIDPKALGFAGDYKVEDVETNQEVPVAGNAMAFTLKRHDVRELRVTAR